MIKALEAGTPGVHQHFQVVVDAGFSYGIERYIRII
jgi:hypothetical protein